MINLEMRDPSLLPRERIPDVSTHLKRRLTAQERRVNIQKTKNMASGPITAWEIDGETVETVDDFILGGAPKSL